MAFVKKLLAILMRFYRTTLLKSHCLSRLKRFLTKAFGNVIVLIIKLIGFQILSLWNLRKEKVIFRLSFTQLHVHVHVHDVCIHVYIAMLIERVPFPFD